MPYNLPQPSTLDDIFKMNPAAFNQAQQFMSGGVQQNDADLQSSQLKNMFDQQNDPLRLQHQGLINQQLDAQLPGMGADSSMKVRANSNESILNNDKLDQAKRDFISKASDAQIKELYDKGQRMAYSLDPRERAQGEAIIAMHPDIVKDRLKQQEETKRQLSTIGMTTKSAEKIAQMNIDAGKFDKTGKSTEFWKVLPTIKGARNIFAAINTELARRKSDNPEDPDIPKLQAMADATENQAKAEINGANARAGTPAMDALGIEVNPDMNIAPKAKTSEDTSIYKQAFGSYEPDKYKYRINPATGKPQRAPK